MDIKSITADQILGVECRFATHCLSQFGGRDDLHVVKEVVSLKSGESFPFVRLVKNFERPYGVTRKGFQNHQQKKEWEKAERVQMFKSTQAQLMRKAAASLEQPWFTGGMRKLQRSPYLYGSDILSTAVLKKSYQQKYPELTTLYTVAPFDIETNVLDGSNDITMATLSFKDRVFTAVDKKFFEGFTDVEARLHEALHKYLGDVVAKRGIKWEVRLVDGPFEVVKACFDKAHEWKPDFVAIWNIDFDLPKCVQAIEKAGKTPAEIFSDPKVPPEFQFYTYKQGPSQKVTASGKVTPIKPAARWHTAFTPASFYLIDAMCAYRHIRNGQQEKQSYKLDDIMNEEIDRGKLNFSEADGLSGLEWHQFMQSKFKFEYVIYNVFDCVGMEMLDESTKDLCLSLPMMSGCSDFQNFKSQPRRVVDELDYFIQARGRVMGTTSDEMATEMDAKTIGLDDWIVMLPAHLVDDNGLCCVEEDPTLRTNIRRSVADLDVAASYPNGECVFNISKETTKKELISIEGVDEFTRRMMGINLSGGATNAVELCNNLWGMPSLVDMLKAFEASQQPTITVETLSLVGGWMDDDKSTTESTQPTSITLSERIALANVDVSA